MRPRSLPKSAPPDAADIEEADRRHRAVEALENVLFPEATLAPHVPAAKPSPRQQGRNYNRTSGCEKPRHVAPAAQLAVRGDHRVSGSQLKEVEVVLASGSWQDNEAAQEQTKQRAVEALENVLFSDGTAEHLDQQGSIELDVVATCLLENVLNSSVSGFVFDSEPGALVADDVQEICN